MPNSMTGFATADFKLPAMRLTWEIRSVNHRFLDLGVRLPESLRTLEPACRQRISERITRGKLDCSLKLEPSAEMRAKRELDRDRLEMLRMLERDVHRELPDAPSLTVGEALGWPGVLVEPVADASDLEGPALDCLGKAVEALCAARAREGQRIAGFIEQRAAAIVEAVQGVAPRIAAAEARYRSKLLERIEKLGVQANPERIEQELALIAQRMDVSEEVDRLGSHVEELHDVLGRAEPVGRRLDFLIQELNREANTLSSKSQDEELTRTAVELKVLIEQIREQAQNLE